MCGPAGQGWQGAAQGSAGAQPHGPGFPGSNSADELCQYPIPVLAAVCHPCSCRGCWMLAGPSVQLPEELEQRVKPGVAGSLEEQKR